MAETKSSIIGTMCETFKNVQESKTCHQQYFTLLKNLYKESDFDEFFDSFIWCIKITLAHEEMNQDVQNALEFAAKFAATLSPPVALNEEKMCPLLEKIFNFIFDNHGAVDTIVRSRICAFLALLMRTMSDYSEEVWINNDIWEKISSSMATRLIDKSPEVRIEAVRALYNLQDATDNNCMVIDKYITHLERDLNPNVRKEIIKNLARTKKAIDAVIQRTIDSDETVRESAYIYLSKYSNIERKSLSKNEQKELLLRGFKDTDKIRNFICKNLLSSWLSIHDNNIMNFIATLNCVDDPDFSELVLSSLLNEQPINTVLKQLPINLEDKLIPIDDITCENLLYWRCLIKHMNNLNYHDIIDRIVPELRDLCDYIHIIRDNMINNYYKMDKKSFEYCLFQLFEMIKMYDCTDEDNTTLIKHLFDGQLKSEICDLKLLKLIVEHYELIIPDVDKRIEILCGIINDIRTVIKTYDGYDSIKNIPDIMIKCLEIMCAMTQASTVKNVNSVIKHLFNNMALPCVKYVNPSVQIVALKAVGICLLLDRELAKKHMSLYLNVLNTYKNNRVIWTMTLTVIFDLFLSYGLEHFDYIHKKGIFNQRSTTGVHIVNMLMEYINHKDQEIRTSIIIGFCKLLLHNIISSVPLVSRLVILLHDPATTNNPLLHQVLTVFFKQYPIETPGSQSHLQNVFFPTLRALLEAPSNSPLKKIDPHKVTNFILDLTSSEFVKSNDKKNHIIHNNLTWGILNQITNPKKGIECDALIKILDNVCIGGIPEKMGNDMLDKVYKIIDDLPLGEYELINILMRLRDKLLEEIKRF